MAEDRRQKYLRMFADEVSDHLEVVSAAIAKFESSGDCGDLEEILRRMHTIKGAAYMVGLQEAGKVAHLLEDELKALRDCQAGGCEHLVPIIYEVVDAFSAYIEEGIQQSQTDQLESELALIRLIDKMENLSRDEVGAEKERPKEQSAKSAKEEGAEAKKSKELPSRNHSAASLNQREIDSLFLSEVEGAVPVEPQVAVSKPLSSPGFLPADGGSETVRVNITKLDRLLELASELVTFQSRLAATAIHDSWLTEEMTELGYLAEDIHLQAMEVRMLPVSTVLKDFQRTTRSLSRELSKEAELVVRGMNVEVDKRILELVKPVVIHTLRNSVDHGIEEPSVRRQLRKPEKGTIELSVESDGNFITFTIQDDGKGVDTHRLSQKAVESGLITKDVVSTLSQEQLVELMFESGLSTARSLSSISGRGVGMDVVKQSVEEMKGTLSVKTEESKGTKIEFSVPTSLSVINALLVEAGDYVYALPLSGVVETVRFTDSEIIKIGDSNGINLRGEAIVLSYLPSLLGFSDREFPSGARTSAVVVKQRSEYLALVVDQILGDQEIVVKSLGSHIRSVRYVSGATFLPSGKPALILHIPQLIGRPSHYGRVSFATSSSSFDQGRVLIVDDSITTQMMESTILQAAGYETQTVSSAEEAISCLENGNEFDIYVVDIEMPGMNGFELIAWMNKSEKHGKIPKILFSSARDHDGWQGSDSLNISAFIPKQEFNQSIFLETVSRLLTEAAKKS